MKMKKIIIISLLLICLFFIGGVSANNDIVELPPDLLSDYDAVGTTEEWSIFTDKYWSTAINNETGEFDLWSFTTHTILSPFSQILGYDWLILIILAFYLLSIWFKGGISMLFIMIGLVTSWMYTMLPDSSIILIATVWSLSLAAILYRLFRSRRGA